MERKQDTNTMDYMDIDLDLTFVDTNVDDNPTTSGPQEALRAGGATSTCVTYWSANRCPSCY